jgi:hypothetical protein
MLDPHLFIKKKKKNYSEALVDLCGEWGCSASVYLVNYTNTLIFFILLIHFS